MEPYVEVGETRTSLFENLYSPSFALHVARFLGRREAILWSPIEDDDNTYGKKAEFWY